MNKSNPKPVAAISLETQKAFAMVECAYYLKLWPFGYGDDFCRLIMILFLNWKATVYINVL